MVKVPRFVYFLLGIFVVPFASAYYFPSFRFASENAIQSIIDFLEPLLNALFGGRYFWGPELLFERLLLFVILVSVIYLALGRVPLFDGADNKKLRSLVSFLVPLIGVRFIDYAQLVAIITSYSVLAIALTAILPFIIYFFFLYNAAGDYPGVRKIGWILFVLVYFGLWTTSNQSSFSAVYFWTMAVSLVFLSFDGTIHGYYIKQKMKAAGNLDKWRYVAALRRDVSELQATTGLPENVKQKLIKTKLKEIEWIMKNM